MTTAAPLTLGTAGHIDHGKTQLVHALTGVLTDRLEEERRRGISIVLGYAPLRLPSGRTLSVIDVPGHERLVRTMVAGATGIDFYLMTVAADDGVMPQTREHAAVLAALGVDVGVVAVTKTDLADPNNALDQAHQLFARAEIVACSARNHTGLDELRAALERAATRLPGRIATKDSVVLHVDRVFTARGTGTIATGTLWSGTIAAGDQLVILPSGLNARVRGIEIHNERRECAEAGQRVAINLAGIRRDKVQPGDVLADLEATLRPATVLDCELTFAMSVQRRMRVQVHHGTRNAPGRMVALGGDFWQLRLERPLIAAPGDRVVVRSVAPLGTLGGGTILDPVARRHGPSGFLLERARRLREPDSEALGYLEPNNSSAPGALGALSATALALELELRTAGHEPPLDADLGDAATYLPELRVHGRAIRLDHRMHIHPDAIAAVRARVEQLVGAEGAVTVARLRDELGTSRKYAQVLLHHLDEMRITLRLADDRRILRQRRPPDNRQPSAPR